MKRFTNARSTGGFLTTQIICSYYFKERDTIDRASYVTSCSCDLVKTNLLDNFSIIDTFKTNMSSSNNEVPHFY